MKTDSDILEVHSEARSFRYHLRVVENYLLEKSVQVRPLGAGEWLTLTPEAAKPIAAADHIARFFIESNAELI